MGGVLAAHFLFLVKRLRVTIDTAVNLQQTVNDTVHGLGFELVELERSAGGLLRVTIDHSWSPDAAEQRFISVEDCERVTRQLQYVLQVEDVDYRRLEVSSPGIDRPLRNAQDFMRFEGELVDLVLKQPIGGTSQGQVAANRKKFRGRLQKLEGEQWRIVWRDAPVAKPGQRVSTKRALPPEQVLDFTLDELQSARLALAVDFKGRGARGAEPTQKYWS